MLKMLWEDWIRAPITGTIILLLAILVIVESFRGNTDRALLYLILGNLHIIQRGPFKRD